MLLAETFVLWFGAVFLIGIIGFFAMAVVMMSRFAWFVLRSLFGDGSSAIRSQGGDTAAAGQYNVCRQPRCGHLNPGGARFCGRCGRRLREAGDVDNYG